MERKWGDSSRLPIPVMILVWLTCLMLVYYSESGISLIY